jgi:hypothetical protein
VMSEPVKRCTKCGDTKSLEHFNKEKLGKYGVGSRCKPCIRAINSMYRERNRDKRREYNKCYYENNREKEMTRNALYRDKNKEKIRLGYRVYRESNLEKCREIVRRWKANNLEKTREYAREYGRRSREYMSDAYLIRKIMQNTTLKSADIPKELIELKRVQLQITRKLRESK